MDNRQIKDGLGDIFTIRMRDVSPAADGSVQRSMILATGYPLDYGAGGTFQHCAKSGLIAAGLPAASTIYSFRWPAPGMIALIRKIRLTAWAVTAFSGGFATFDLFAARNFTSNDTGGLSTNFATGESNQLRTSMASAAGVIGWGNTGGISPGNRTLDAAPLDSCTAVAPMANNVLFSDAPLPLLDKRPGDHPLYLLNNEGVAILATVPSSNSTWQFAVTLEWDEVQTY